MKLLVPVLLASALLLAGCGGHSSDAGGNDLGGFKTVYSVSPGKATVAPGGALGLTASVLEGGYKSVSLAVREGAAGGTLVPVAADPDKGTGDGATYTAPATPGTYHVDATFTGLDGTGDAGKTHAASATITVAASG